LNGKPPNTSCNNLPSRNFPTVVLIAKWAGKQKKKREHVIRGNLEMNTRIEELTLQK